VRNPAYDGPVGVFEGYGEDPDQLKSKTESVAVGHKCSICEEVIAAGEVAVRDGEDFAHLCCSVWQADGDDIDAIRARPFDLL